MKKTQSDLILEHLKKGFEITPLEAARPPFSTMYLSSIIRDLRKEGHDIAVRRKPGKKYNFYFLVQKELKVGA